MKEPANLKIDTAMILAAGYGTRLGNITRRKPKALLDLGNYTLLDIQLHKLRQAGIRKIVINLHYHGELIRKHIQNGPYSDLEILFSEEADILGTGGGIAQASDFLGNEPVLLVNADIISDLKLTDFLNFYQTRQSVAAITVWPSQNFRDYALVRFHPDGFLTGFLNKNQAPDTDGNVGIYMGYYILTAEARSYLQARFSSVIEDFFRKALQENKLIDVYLHHGLWIDIGTQANFESACQLVQQDVTIFEKLLG